MEKYIPTIDSILNNYWYYLGLLLLVIVIIDIFSAFRYYYSVKYYDYAVHTLDSKRLKYLRETVISGYRILASQKSIDKAIKQVRVLEEDLGETPIDFSEHEVEYNKNIKDVFKRGYF